MPTAPGRTCTRPGCRGVVRGDACSVCGPYKRIDHHKSVTSQDSRWKKYAPIYRRQHPLCEVCLLEGRTTATQCVHHIEGAREGEVVVPEEKLLAVCNSCHQRVEGLGKEWRRVVKQIPPAVGSSIIF